MTVDEAIKIIQGRMDTCFLNDALYPSELSMAISALEKQIPKRPILCKSDEQTTRYTADYRCPKCNGMFTGTGIADYCYHCGQRLDWSEDE